MLQRDIAFLFNNGRSLRSHDDHCVQSGPDARGGRAINISLLVGGTLQLTRVVDVNCICETRVTLAPGGRERVFPIARARILRVRLHDGRTRVPEYLQCIRVRYRDPIGGGMCLRLPVLTANIPTIRRVCAGVRERPSPVPGSGEREDFDDHDRGRQCFPGDLREFCAGTGEREKKKKTN